MTQHEIAALAGLELARHITEKADLQDRLDELVNGILNLAPECWDGDEAAESLALDFVRSLVGELPSSVPGHRDECTCFA